MNADLDFLTARLHARRAGIAEGRRLDQLCQLEELAEFSEALFGARQPSNARELQRRLLQELLTELIGIAEELRGPAADLLNWVLVRFQLEHIKVVLRGFLGHAPDEKINAHQLLLPPQLAVNSQKLLTAASLEDFANKLRVPFIAEALLKALRDYGESASPFFLENAIEAAYLRLLLVRSEALPVQDRQLTTPIVRQEIDTFHFLLIVRSRFHYKLEPESLMPLQVDPAGISGHRFRAMLAAPDVLTLVRLAAGHALEATPSRAAANAADAPQDATILERLARHRLWRLANRSFRRSHMGVPAVFSYATIRRVEVANLITISEGINAGFDRGALRARLTPPVLQEAR